MRRPLLHPPARPLPHPRPHRARRWDEPLRVLLEQPGGEGRPDIDWQGLPNTVGNYSAGWGDGTSRFLNSLTPAGALYDHFDLGVPTQVFRTVFGYDGNVDYGSGAYRWGGYTHTAWETAATFAFPGELAANSMKIMVGRGSPSHVMYEVGGDLIHGGGTVKGAMMTEIAPPGLQRMITSGQWKPWVTFSLPIRNVEAAARTGMSAKNCVNAAMKAFMRGWGF